ncbi:MAG: hypothetical protein D084_Lepto4C00283G0005 [Leptospirillum sp. Group IV 'UBA BS']|nr:MAG: hypothetical protein D084_Lepto4C00283G0005 [Leptospirillum sp. Group IV 'UBA BS']
MGNRLQSGMLPDRAVIGRSSGKRFGQMVFSLSLSNAPLNRPSLPSYNGLILIAKDVHQRRLP